MKIYGRVLRTDEEKLRNGVTPCYYPNQMYYLGDTISSDKKSVGRYLIAGCSGRATQLLQEGWDGYGQPRYPDVTDVMSWGYQGRGADLLAAWLIGHASYYPGKMCESCASSITRATLATIRHHYKAFSEEVIANLPDEWEMDTEWVLEWIKEREAKHEHV